jgi:hypothetical protein
MCAAYLAVHVFMYRSAHYKVITKCNTASRTSMHFVFIEGDRRKIAQQCNKLSFGNRVLC